MAMHHAAGQGAGIVEELLPDPEEVMLDLVLDGIAWPDAGVDEEVRSVVVGERQAGQKARMSM